MTPRPMSEAPRDGTRILLHHWVVLLAGSAFVEGGGYRWERAGTAWSECRWVDDQARTGSRPHWEPWCGNERTTTTEHIPPKNAIRWLPVPPE